MNDLLLRLRDKGNTVLVVEHKPEAIAIADHVVDLGPAPARPAARSVFEGTVEGCAPATRSPGGTSTTARTLKPSGAHAATGALRGPRRHDPQPARTSTSTSRSACSCVVTGVAGSGKSSLIHGSVPRRRVVVVDQGAIKGSRRSNPATYTGLLEPIRKAFAKANGVKPALFSANSEGACPTCNGAGRHLHRPRR
jgi:excinuclease UvrABC ATPase subunit